MGCDIHLIVQVKKNNKWEAVKEKPKEFTQRNYSIFSILANVRNSFNSKYFEPKGLPDDIGLKRYDFNSYYDYYKNMYEKDTKEKIKLPDGKIVNTNDKRFEKIVSEEEAKSEKYNGFSFYNNEYHVYDYDLLNGAVVKIPIKKLMTEEEFWAEKQDEYDENAKDYGYWSIDFDSEDYHSHSYLSLKELDDFDKTDYCLEKIKISKKFYDKFIELGGVMPKQMEVVDEYPNDNFVEALREFYNPCVIIQYNADNCSEYPLFKGIDELKEIAKQYGIDDYNNIRIVFAFDN